MASTRKGNKPDFHGAAGGEKARELYDRFVAKVAELYEPQMVKNGVFQAMMEGEYRQEGLRRRAKKGAVNIQNSGPVGVKYSSLDEAVS